MSSQEKSGSQVIYLHANRYLQSILVKDDEFKFVDVDKINWIEAAGNYVKIHCESATHMIRASLKKMEEKLNPKKFIRIHKSSMINVDKVHFIESRNTGDLQVEMQSGEQLNISRNYKENLEKFKI